ncbi:MAG: hypothetical protein AAF802_10385 [Planctomycetota bacterium]
MKSCLRILVFFLVFTSVAKLAVCQAPDDPFRSKRSVANSNPFGPPAVAPVNKPALPKTDPFDADPFDADPFDADPFDADPFASGNQSDGPGSDPFAAPKRRPVSPSARQRANSVANATVVPRQPFAIAATGEMDASLRLEAVLDQKTSLRLIETPLSEAAQVISDMHGLPVVIDSRALEEFGLDRDTGVNVNLKQVKLRTSLRLMLADLDCTYVVADEVVRITTKRDAERHKQVKFYRLPSDLVDCGDRLVSMVETHVSPDAWQSSGGSSSVELINHVLIVSATTEVHYAVNQFLAKLHAAHSLGPAE